MIEFFLAGFVGGILRGALGIAKYSTSYKDVAIRPYYFAGTIVLSGIVGLAAAWVTQDLGIAFLGVEVLSPAVALVIGYAGGDFLENVSKTVLKNPMLMTKSRSERD